MRVSTRSNLLRANSSLAGYYKYHGGSPERVDYNYRETPYKRITPESLRLMRHAYDRLEQFTRMPKSFTVLHRNANSVAIITDEPLYYGAVPVDVNGTALASVETEIRTLTIPFNINSSVEWDLVSD